MGLTFLPFPVIGTPAVLPEGSPSPRLLRLPTPPGCLTPPPTKSPTTQINSIFLLVPVSCLGLPLTPHSLSILHISQSTLVNRPRFPPIRTLFVIVNNHPRVLSSMIPVLSNNEVCLPITHAPGLFLFHHHAPLSFETAPSAICGNGIRQHNKKRDAPPINPLRWVPWKHTPLGAVRFVGVPPRRQGDIPERGRKGFLQERRGEWPISERREPHNKRRRRSGDGSGPDKTHIEQDGWRSVELIHGKKGK